jgi:hypothetical protein
MQEVEIRSTEVGSQPGQNVSETPSPISVKKLSMHLSSQLLGRLQ